MQFDFSPLFAEYEALVKEADDIFDTIKQQHPACVVCGQGCDDCCYAMFDLSLVQALYVHHHFHQRYAGAKRSAILDRADEADREAYRFKRRLFKASQEGLTTTQIMEEVARARIRCPLLGEAKTCELYEHRPITCRLYGLPQAVNGQARTCGLARFEKGVAYPTVNIEAFQDRLMLMSHKFVASLPTSHVEMGDMLVPVSMALLTTYDKDFLGVKDESCDSGGTWVIGGEDGDSYFVPGCEGCTASECDPANCGGAKGGGE